jgi:carbon monoxide dehydrogenase subunit G
MACIRKEVTIDAPAAFAWDAVRDFGAVHRRLVPGVLTDCRGEPGARVVAFANGLVVRELLVDVDDARRRLVYAAVGGRTTHHNAAIEVAVEDARRCRLIWTTDFLPAEMAAPIGALVDLGATTMKATLEKAAAASAA